MNIIWIYSLWIWSMQFETEIHQHTSGSWVSLSISDMICCGTTLSFLSETAISSWRGSVFKINCGLFLFPGIFFFSFSMYLSHHSIEVSFLNMEATFFICWASPVLCGPPLGVLAVLWVNKSYFHPFWRNFPSEFSISGSPCLLTDFNIVINSWNFKM